MKIIEQGFISKEAKIVIVIARFNEFINQQLLIGSIDTLKRIGEVKDHNITVIKVPGAYEIPIVINNLANLKKYDAIIALGTIIKGNTTHFMHITNQIHANLSAISMNNNIPISIGVITADNIEQAIERAGTKLGNKGKEATLSALETINILQTIEKQL